MGETSHRSRFWADVRELMGVGAVGVLLLFMAAEILVSPLSILAWFGLIFLSAFAVAAAAVALLLGRDSPRPRLWSVIRILIAGAGAVVLVVLSVWALSLLSGTPAHMVVTAYAVQTLYFFGSVLVVGLGWNAWMTVRDRRAALLAGS